MKVTGKTLIDLGFREGRWLKDALVHINEHELEGELLTNYLTQYEIPPVQELHEEAIAFSINIKAENELEAQNVDSVVSSMEKLMRTPT